MAFNLQNFQFARGVDSSYAQGQGITTVMHTYKSDVDTIAIITTVGYFPDKIDGRDKVFANDQIMIIGSDSTALVNITAVSPLSVGINLLATGANLTVGAPVAAADDNGLVIAGNILKAELATASRPGIVSSTNQAFGGVKSFGAGIEIGTGSDLSFSDFHSINIPVTWTGPFTASQSGSIDLQQFNNIVYCTVTGIPPAAQSVNAYITSGVVIPAAYRPIADIHDLIRVTDDTTQNFGVISILTTGNILIGVGVTNIFFSGVNFAGCDDKVLGWKLS